VKVLIVEDEKKGLNIANSCPGIPNEDQPKVFDRFHRAGGGRGARVDGIGLGLSLARETVHAHGGELLLRESRPGWTRFELRLSPKS
jgi:signal transduction histidine kinase